MKQFDANLLLTLDALLQDESVTMAAERMEISVPAMSHALLRLRKLMNDPLLVRAGRGLVPTPKALDIRARVHTLAQEARALVYGNPVPLQDIKRTFTITTEEALIGTFAASLTKLIHESAPGITLRFLSERPHDIGPLREGTVDLTIVGNIKLRGPEVKVQRLVAEWFGGVVRPGHALAKGKITAKRYAECEHIVASRRGVQWGPIDDALKEAGLKRHIAVIVPTFYSALLAAASSDMVASVPIHHTRTAIEALGLYAFSIPLSLKPGTISQAWHPRFDADPLHRFVRECVRSECKRLWPELQARSSAKRPSYGRVLPHV